MPHGHDGLVRRGEPGELIDSDGRAGRWTRAHEIAQDDPGLDTAWVHAYLHRREGDLANAAYWYRQAGRPVARGGLDEEWRDLVTALLAHLRAGGRACGAIRATAFFRLPPERVVELGVQVEM